ncbi:centromere protein T [Tupaia chinensis]|uniref:centromere protein T n=1 Tax=Tupaia chinensis TaxID=246437 RepID=UPI0003C8C9B4|nr:centromere protein T [Tupaia chinensis]
MADINSPDSEPTTRTLLRRVLDTATPRRPRSASARRTLYEKVPSRNLRSQTKTPVRQCTHEARPVGKLARVQASGHLEEQTPRTLLKNILLSAPESATLMPESMVKPVPAPQVVQPSRRESSRGSLELRLPELEPSTTLAPGVLAPGKRKQRLRLSMFQQEVDQGLPPSQEPPGTADASSVTSSLNLTFATPLQPQSVRRPGLSRRPLTRRAVDVGAFMQDLHNSSLALAPSGDLLRAPAVMLPTDTVLEDTQPFSQPMLGYSPSVHRSLPRPSHSGAEDADRAANHRTQSHKLGLQNYHSPGEPAQFLAGKAEEVDVELSGGEVGEEAEDRMEEEGLHVSKVKEAAGGQELARTGEPEGHTQVSEAEASQRATEAEEPEESSMDEDVAGRAASPEVARSTPRFLQAKQVHQFLKPAPPSGVAASSSEALELLSARISSRHQTVGPRPQRDPYKAGLSHYAKLFSFYAKMPMEKKAFEMVEKCLDKYFQYLCDDLEVFATHAGRKTVKPEDLQLLMRRQGLVTDQVSLHVLVERHLPLEYRQLLIPCAFSGNSVFPAQ